MSGNLLRYRSADTQTAKALQGWEAEGGAPLALLQGPRADASMLSTAERELLQRLGAAVVGEWDELPMPLQRALFDQAVSARGWSDPAALKARMARFLHDRKGDAASW